MIFKEAKCISPFVLHSELKALCNVDCPQCIVHCDHPITVCECKFDAMAYYTLPDKCAVWEEWVLEEIHKMCSAENETEFLDATNELAKLFGGSPPKEEE